MYEGQLAGGHQKWTGYGRWIENGIAVGWWGSADAFKGQGITHIGEHFRWEGHWDETDFFEAPAHEFVVNDLRQQVDEEKIKEA